YDTMYVETGRYLRQMIRDVQVAGGKIEVRRFTQPADIAALPETLVFNCTGLGSRDLFGDAGLHPVRGQLAILEPQPEIRYAITGGPGYMFPRADGILLGGTFEVDQWDAAPDPAEIQRIIAAHKRFFASLRCTA
ncbi:MAG TPA: FAD-dependent oxidoreductase, partial [Sphingomicrobium sp.]|nr:FAD-dependent oxidoreductase [Sphingomicrobium sp.]